MSATYHLLSQQASSASDSTGPREIQEDVVLVQDTYLSALWSRPASSGNTFRCTGCSSLPSQHAIRSQEQQLTVFSPSTAPVLAPVLAGRSWVREAMVEPVSRRYRAPDSQARQNCVASKGTRRREQGRAWRLMHRFISAGGNPSCMSQAWTLAINRAISSPQCRVPGFRNK